MVVIGTRKHFESDNHVQIWRCTVAAAYNLSMPKDYAPKEKTWEIFAMPGCLSLRDY